MADAHTIDVEAEEPQGASAGRHGGAGAPLLGRPVQVYHGTGRERWRGGLRRLAVSPARRCRTGEDGCRARSEPLSVAAGEEEPAVRAGALKTAQRAPAAAPAGLAGAGAAAAAGAPRLRVPDRAGHHRHMGAAQSKARLTP